MAARRIAIVTGGNRGIGHEIARQLVKNDVYVVIGCRDAMKCDEAVSALKKEGPNVSGFPLDVVDTHSVRRFVEHVAKHHGAPAILVNNAGVYPESTQSRVVDTPTSVWRETLETNLFGAVRMCREIVPHMEKLRNGRIVNMSSGLGQIAHMGEGSPAYRTSKAALNALTRTAWAASDRVAVVTEPGLFSVAAADRALRAIEEIRRGLSPRLQPLGIIVNRARVQSLEHQFRIKELRDMFGPLVLSPQLPERTSLQQAQGAAKPLHVWPGESAQEMAHNFDMLLERVLRTARIGEYAGVQ